MFNNRLSPLNGGSLMDAKCGSKLGTQAKSRTEIEGGWKRIYCDKLFISK